MSYQCLLLFKYEFPDSLFLANFPKLFVTLSSADDLLLLADELLFNKALLQHEVRDLQLIMLPSALRGAVDHDSTNIPIYI